MKSTIFLYISLIIFLQFFIIINSKKESIKENKEKETTEEENKEEKEETSESKEKEAEGHMMTDEEFEEKLQAITEKIKKYR